MWRSAPDVFLRLRRLSGVFRTVRQALRRRRRREPEHGVPRVALPGGQRRRLGLGPSLAGGVGLGGTLAGRSLRGAAALRLRLLLELLGQLRLQWAQDKSWAARSAIQKRNGAIRKRSLQIGRPRWGLLRPVYSEAGASNKKASTDILQGILAPPPPPLFHPAVPPTGPMHLHLQRVRTYTPKH